MDFKKLHILFEKKFGQKPDSLSSLTPSGSHRKYYRLNSSNHTAIGVINNDSKENIAFLSFASAFHNLGLNVPEIYEIHEDNEHYLLQDLGDKLLKDIVDEAGEDIASNNYVINLYKQALSSLVKFQILGKDAINFDLCIPRDSFDNQSILWDLNHFKYFFLKISKITFDEQKLEYDFESLSSELDKIDRRYFMYRDFQSRNIMIHNDKCFFIDFQGGRKGALQYDVASLLFEAKTNLPHPSREELLGYYLEELSKYISLDKNEFINNYYKFVLIRILQALGAYGQRGWVEKKPLFLQSIPFAIKNLKWLRENKRIPLNIPELSRLINVFIEDRQFDIQVPVPEEKLRIEINSFSYRKALPDDLSGNGGGFIFDCRSINNPGLYPELKGFTGKDREIQSFFEKYGDMGKFLDDIYAILSKTIRVYQEKKYKHLQVNFGCTGGRHRSVYAAEQITKKIAESFDVIIDINHRELTN
jgi:aminoglycoside/choline kinase family phosphotransferase